MTNHLLIIGFVFPEPASSAAGNRTMQLISLFQSEGWKITFASAASDSEFAEDLSDYGIDQQRIVLNDPSFDLFVKALRPSVVIFDRFMIEEQFGWRVAENCPDALRILDTIDLHSLRLARQAAWKAHRKFENEDLFSDNAKREIASMLRCDLSLMISEYEMELLQEEFKIDSSLLYYLPLFARKKTEIFHFHERRHFIFIGNFLHEPNWNSVLYLKESIWPLIRKRLPGAELHVYGAYPSQKVFNLHNAKEAFIVKGRAEVALEVMSKARVCLAPLRFGAGIKGKLLDAMECGTPSVTTSIGAESMHGELPWNGFVADDVEAFADAAVELYSSESVWNQAQNNGFEILVKRYDRGLHEKLFAERLSELQNDIHMHRLQNFMGAMLMHHTMLSTRYMSRWIEEKNR